MQSVSGVRPKGARITRRKLGRIVNNIRRRRTRKRAVTARRKRRACRVSQKGGVKKKSPDGKESVDIGAKTEDKGPGPEASSKDKEPEPETSSKDKGPGPEMQAVRIRKASSEDKDLGPRRAVRIRNRDPRRAVRIRNLDPRRAVRIRDRDPRRQ